MTGPDDKFVAKRGSQGDEWRWETVVPPEPAKPQPRKGSRLAAARERLAAVAAGASGWLRALRRPSKAPSESPPGDTGAPEPAPKAPSRAPQAPAHPILQNKLPDGRPLTLGGVVRWSSVIPFVRRPRPRETVTWSKSGERPKWSLAAPRAAAIPQDSNSLLVLLAALCLAGAIVLGVIVGVSALADGEENDGIVAPVTETPRVTLIPPASQTPRPTRSATPTPAPSHSPSATSTASPSPTSTPAPTRTPAPPVAPGPQGAVAAAMWANTSGVWWFGSMGGTVARYEEGQTVPLLLQWNASAGQTYRINLTYDCAGGGAAAIDFLSGTQDWGKVIVFAKNGPAKDSPDAGVLVPDTSGFSADDGNSGVISAYGGKFTVLPGAPTPDGACLGTRTLSLSVEATAQKVTLLLSGHLARATVHGAGEGASSAASAFGVSVSVEGVGASFAGIDPRAITNEEH